MPQCSILGPLFFLIYFNDLTGNLNSNVKLFVDDTSLFSEICDQLETENVLNNDLRKIRKRDEQCKMVFNADPTKQVRVVTFRVVIHILQNISIYTLIDKPNNMSICNKTESLQYNVTLAITGAIRGSSKEKLFQELSFEHLSSRRWCGNFV